MYDLTTIRTQVDKKLAEFNLVRKKYKEENEALITVDFEIENTTEAQRTAQHVAQRVQQKAHDQIAGVVSKCLEAVFDEPYSFKIHFERKRGKTEARLTFERDGFEVDPMTASGGGVVDVAAFALRLSCLLLTRPPVRKIMILDEPFRFVSSDLRDRVRILIEDLSKEMGVQFFIITHMNQLRTGKIIQLWPTIKS